MKPAHYLPIVALLGTALCAQAVTLRVPQDRRSIQRAIEAAQDGDDVLVSPGTYNENIDFLGKAITVHSTDGPKSTIIDGGQRDSVVIFQNGEGRQSVIRGFTLRNGNAAQFPLNGGGVNVVMASPTIDGNHITGSSACSGNGVGLYFSGALVRRNRIFGNHQNGCSGGTLGGGIYIGGSGDAVVVDNIIENNQTDMAGGGIGINASGVVRVERNIIRGNLAGSQGGGVATYNDSQPIVASNLVVANRAVQGGGLYLSPPFGSTGGVWVNNTVADNTGDNGSEIHTTGFADQIQLTNNIVRASGTAVAVVCDTSYSTAPPQFRNNDLFATRGTLLSGSCTGIIGTQGNLSVDPLLTGGKPAVAYRLQAGSPAIDAGQATAAVGRRDLAGQRRVVDGNGDGQAVIDLGAYEWALP